MPEEIKIAFEDKWPQEWPIEFFQPSWEAETETGDLVPAYPTVVLGSWWLGDPFPVSVTAEITDVDGSICAVSGMVQGRYEVELRLCIAPIGKALRATPALRVHLGATLSPLFNSAAPPPAGASSGVGVAAADDAAPILTFPGRSWPNLKRGKSSIRGQNPAIAQAVTCEICVERDAIPYLFEKYFRDINSAVSETSSIAYGVRFLPIRPTVCEDWFGFRVSEDHYETDMRDRVEIARQIGEMRLLLAERALGYALQEPAQDQFFFPIFGYDTIADMIDHSLRNAENGLDLQFDARAADLTRAFEESRSRTLKEREEEWRRVEERWADSSPASDD